MKNLIILLFIQTMLFSQNNIGIINNRTNMNLFIGYDNPFTIIIENESCDDIFIKIDNGKYSQNSERCSLNIFPDKIGDINILIYLRDKLIQTFKLKVVHPKFKVIYESINNDEITDFIDLTSSGIYNIDFFKNPFRLYIDTSVLSSDFSFKLQYTVVIIRNGTELFKQTSNDIYFNKIIKEKFKELKKGDLILFKDMKCITNVINDNIDDLIFLIQ